MKKKLALLLCLALCLSMISGISALAEDKKKIVLWTWAPGQFDCVIDAYFAAHPDADWEFEEVVVSSDDYLTKLQQGYATGGDMPDILMAEMTWRASAFALDIWENLEAEPYNFDRSLILDYVPSVNCDAAGNLVGIENGQNPSFIAYKRDMAKEWLGTDDRAELEAMFQTYDDYFRIGQEVYEKSNGAVTLFPGMIDFEHMLVMQKRDINNVNENGEVDVSEKAKFILGLVEKARDSHAVGNLTQWSTEWYANYAQSNNILFPSASWSITYQIEPNDPEGIGNWGAFIPVGGGYGWGGTSYGIYKDSKMKDEAWDFLQWSLLSVEGAQYMKQASFFVVLKEAYEDPAFTEGTRPNFGDMPIVDFMMKEIATTIPSASISLYDGMVTDSLAMVAQMMATDDSIDAETGYEYFMEDLQAKIPDVTVK